MKIRLYFDEDSMDRDLMRALAARGVDVSSAIEAGLIACPDRQHLEHAASEGRALYSFNVGDFNRLHSSSSRKGGRTAASSSPGSSSTRSESRCGVSSS